MNIEAIISPYPSTESNTLKTKLAILEPKAKVTNGIMAKIYETMENPEP